MRGSKDDLPAAAEMEEGAIREVQWGGMNVEIGTFSKGVDIAPLFKGLPDDRCQCPHWGYVVKGQIGYKFADHEETYRAGDVYYAAPGHLPIIEDGSEWVEFSPEDRFHETMEVVERNMSAEEGRS